MLVDKGVRVRHTTQRLAEHSKRRAMEGGCIRRLHTTGMATNIFIPFFGGWRQEN